MLRLLQSIFGGGEKAGKYPESLVALAIERAVDGTDPLLRLVPGYKKKLRPAVIRTIDHVIELVNALPPPLAADPGRRGDDPLLRTFFISGDEMRTVFAGDHNLSRFLRGETDAPREVFAMLAMEKEEGVTFCAEQSGDAILRDVPRRTVGFRSHRLVDPSADWDTTVRLLRRRAFDHLLSLALGRISSMKTERKDLERRHALLQSKLGLLRRGGWSFGENIPSGSPDIANLEAQLGRIEAQLLEMGGDDRVLDLYLATVVDVLGRPEDHLWGSTETLILDRLNIRRDQLAGDADEMTLYEIKNGEGMKLTVYLVSLSGAVLPEYAS